jgi:hypothetical protein
VHAGASTDCAYFNAAESVAPNARPMSVAPSAGTNSGSRAPRWWGTYRGPSVAGGAKPGNIRPAARRWVSARLASAHSDDRFGVITRMGFLHNLKLRFSPPRIDDPDFGSLLFMFIPNAPERSYWECEWKFPRTGTEISIGLPGGESGPSPEARQFYLSLPERFDQILDAARPQLQEVFRTWLQQDLPQDIFTVVKLAGFDLEDPKAQPVQWDISFETTGDEWLGIIVPFIGDTPQEATVDT